MNEYDLNGNPKKPCAHPRHYQIGSWAEPTGPNQTILGSDPHGPTVRCTECGQIFRPTWKKWFEAPPDERLIQATEGYVTDLVRVWNKSAHLPVSDEELVEAGREVVKLLTPTLLFKYPQFKELDFDEQRHLKGYIVHTPHRSTPQTEEEIISTELESGHKVKFDPEVHCVVSVPIQVVGRGTWVVFEIPKHPERKTCPHEKVAQVGNWDGHNPKLPGKGINTGGPVVKCRRCGKKLNLTHKEWGRLPQEKKTS